MAKEQTYVAFSRGWELRLFSRSLQRETGQELIDVIENAEGTALYDEALIAQEITTLYQSIFTANSGENLLYEPNTVVDQAISLCISADTNERLIKIPSPEEVRVAMFSIHPDKAPRPDGFSACFVQSYRSTVGSIITKETREFFRSDCSRTKSMIHTWDSSRRYRARSWYQIIALSNVVYKLIS